MLSFQLWVCEVPPSVCGEFTGDGGGRRDQELDQRRWTACHRFRSWHPDPRCHLQDERLRWVSVAQTNLWALFAFLQTPIKAFQWSNFRNNHFILCELCNPKKKILQCLSIIFIPRLSISFHLVSLYFHSMYSNRDFCFILFNNCVLAFQRCQKGRKSHFLIRLNATTVLSCCSRQNFKCHKYHCLTLYDMKLMTLI